MPVQKTCEMCQHSFTIPPCEVLRRYTCSRKCAAEKKSARWMGNTLRKGLRPSNAWKTGEPAWNKGNPNAIPQTAGMIANRFKGGQPGRNWKPVGSTCIRNDKFGLPRAWVKIAEPKKWKPRAQLVWESVNGPIPRGYLVHHDDRNTLNDDIQNLILLSRAAHINEHRHEFREER